MSKKRTKKYWHFDRVANEQDIMEMYQANEDFIIPKEIEDAIKALTDK